MSIVQNLFAMGVGMHVCVVHAGHLVGVFDRRSDASLRYRCVFVSASDCISPNILQTVRHLITFI